MIGINLIKVQVRELIRKQNYSTCLLLSLFEHNSSMIGKSGLVLYNTDWQVVILNTLIKICKLKNQSDPSVW